VVVAWAAVWNTSVQLGLSTWWLGPRSDPTPQVFRLVPFLGPLAIVIGVIDNARWLPYLGVVAGAVFGGYGIGDRGRVSRLGWLGVIIGTTAIAVSVASLTGMLRRLPAGPTPPPAPDEPAR